MAESQEPISHRLCVSGLNRGSVGRLVVAFQTYHALRNQHTSLITGAVDQANFDPVCLTACELAVHFAEEMQLR